ncbi:MAG: protein translocase subunit SecD [Planctomycetota bacterium]|jgi:SecD/SecF fusion protein
MEKNLTPKVIFIIVLVAVLGWTLYPPSKTLKPGIDLAGGTSLVYEIDTQGLEPGEKRDVAQRMITVLRRRIDPANIQNLVWRPQGSRRFEIQMPLASAKAREERDNYKKVKDSLLEENIYPAVIMRSLQKPVEERAADFNDIARGSASRLSILEEVATAYDERDELRKRRDELGDRLKVPENLITLAGLDLDSIKLQLGEWMKLNEQELTEALKEYLGSEGNVDLLTRYVKRYSEWAEVVEQLTDAETGINVRYDKARKALDKLNISEEQIDFALDLPVKSAKRASAIEDLKAAFPDRVEKIEQAVAAFDKYRPFRGRLDDPGDLKRLLKGAGILEFRILPTLGHAEVDESEMAVYVERLKEKGPKYASDNRHVWCEVEDVEGWGAFDEGGNFFSRVRDNQEGPAIIAPFGDKYYVLASNKQNEVMLHRAGEEKSWRLEDASKTQDQMGRLAIGFRLDERGGILFSRVSGRNIGRPLCILLDGIAISAPNLKSRIGRDGIIEGVFTRTEVDDMVSKLDAGSLPARLIEQPISEKTIGPFIGADNRDRGIRAGLIGLAAVIACMAVYYMLAGSIADVALLLNLLFVLGIMALVRATFTLPGIAGIILTIGMSVDANVLIFERIREEQVRGSSLRIAVRNGYQRAFRTIFDANLTTFITAAILFWVASEEIKGFAIVLMLGIVSSMFTALFVTRVFFDILLARRIIKEHIAMLRLIRNPKVNWMGLRPVFLTISAVLIAGGLTVFFTRDNTKNNKYDIEFTGGTSVQINLKEQMGRQEVEDTIRKAGADLGNRAIAAANVYSVGKTGKQYEINTTETNKTTTRVTLSRSGENAVETATSAIRKAQAKIGGRLSNLRVMADNDGGELIVTTSQVNKSVVRNILTAAFPDANMSEPEVEEIVNDAILTAFRGKLEIQESLEPEIAREERIGEEVLEAHPELADFMGGIKLTCKLRRPATVEEIEDRLGALRFKPDTRDLRSYYYTILNSDLSALEGGEAVESFVYVSADPEAGFRELSEDEWEGFSENEKQKVLAATKLETSLPRVTQIDPSVGAEAKTRALIAIILSLFAIVTYIWIRFGNVRYGLAAITALVHDVCITLGAVTACTYIASTAIGERLLIGDFKISLAMIAAFLTLIGYSLNDTIVVFDRIRENRKKGQLNPRIITDSINQTISRTLMTSFTTFIVVLIMYIFGGAGLRGFTFAIGFGVIVGTYSSIAIAAPILLLGGGRNQGK